jgi:hypothetical protein
VTETALVFTGLWLACLLFLHVAPTGYDPLRNAVSEYGVGRFAWGYRAQVTCAALAALALAAALPAGTRREIALLVVFAAARLAIAAFPTDLLGSERITPTGRVHLLLAAIAFASICWCACALRRADGGQPVLGYVASAGAVGTMLALRRVPELRPVLGLLERIFYAAVVAWFFLVAVRLS